MTKEEFVRKYAGFDIVVHCPTVALAREFLHTAHEFGFKWNNGYPYKGNLWWGTYCEQTCYRVYNGVYCSMEFYKSKKMTVVEFAGFRDEGDIE